MSTDKDLIPTMEAGKAGSLVPVAVGGGMYDVPAVAAPLGHGLGHFHSQKTVAEAPPVKKLRHRAEMPMIWLGLVLTFTVLLGVILVVLDGDTPAEWTLPIVFGLVLPVASLVMIRHMYWKTITDAIPVGPNQFPELYQLYHDLAIEMGFEEDGKGLAKIPRLYVTNGNGTMNAFASKCRLQRGYVTLYSDLLDVAYTHGDFGAIRFVLAHELGHIKCRHVSLWRGMINPVMTVLRLSPTVTRAQEYTADRVALYYAGDCADGMIALYAGKNLAHRVNVDAYFEAVAEHKDGFWLRVVNFLADHAVGFRRMKVIEEARTKGWDVHGKML